METTSRSFERSFSYGPDDSLDMHRRSVTQKKTARSHSIVGSLWNMLYARRASSASIATRQLQSEEETDHPEQEAGKQEDVWMQAYCNAVALVVLLIAGCICWAVYCVLEPFLHPLLWAVLVGTMLHPFKKTWTERISQWLDGLEENGIPLSAGLFLSPVFFFNYLSKSLESAVATHWTVMLGSVAGVAVLGLLYHLSVPLHLYRSLASLYSFVRTVETALTGYTGPVQLATLTVGFVLLLVITKSQVRLKYTTALTILSTCVWFLAMLNGAGYVVGGTLALPLVVCLFVAGATVSFAVTIRNMLEPSNSMKLRRSAERRRGGEGGGEKGDVPGVEGAKEECDDSSGLEEVKCSGDLRVCDGDIDEDEGEMTLATDPPSKSFSDSLSLGDLKEKSRVSFGAVTEVSPQYTPEAREFATEAKILHRHSASDSDKGLSQSDYIFLGLYVSFFVMMFWTYPFLLFLLIPFGVWGALKRAISFGRSSASLSKLLPTLSRLGCWLVARKSLLVPTPIPTLLQLYLVIDRKILKIAKGSLDTLISLFIISGLLVGVLGLTVFLVLQIQVELSHYITMMSAVWERALAGNPQLAE